MFAKNPHSSALGKAEKFDNPHSCGCYVMHFPRNEQLQLCQLQGKQMGLLPFVDWKVH